MLKTDGQWSRFVDPKHGSKFHDFDAAETATEVLARSVEASEVTLVELRPVMVLNGAGGPVRRHRGDTLRSVGPDEDGSIDRDPRSVVETTPINQEK